MSHLYRLYSAAGELLYVGKSVHRFRRFDEHCRNQPWAAEIATAHFQEFTDAAALSAAEVAAIKRDRPKYNKVHVTKEPVNQYEKPVGRVPPMARLTVKAVENLRPRAQRYEVHDPGCPGLYLLVHASGAKSWAYRYRFAGKSRKLTIGTAYTQTGIDVLKIGDARDAANAARVSVAKRIDPIEANRSGGYA